MLRAESSMHAIKLDIPTYHQIGLSIMISKDSLLILIRTKLLNFYGLLRIEGKTMLENQMVPSNIRVKHLWMLQTKHTSYFSSVFTKEDIAHIPTLSTDPGMSPHVDGIYQLLSNIQQHKASGPDNLPARFLKEVANEISPTLSLIFQASLDQGTLPSIWKTAKIVVPVYKKDSKSDPCYYRPVSLACIYCKY